MLVASLRPVVAATITSRCSIRQGDRQHPVAETISVKDFPKARRDNASDAEVAQRPDFGQPKRLKPAFIIRDHNGHALSCVYFADEPDETRKIAAELRELAEMKSPGSSCLKEVASEAPGLPVQTGPGGGKTRCTELA
jgi:hypothetical protein